MPPPPPEDTPGPQKHIPPPTLEETVGKAVPRLKHLWAFHRWQRHLYEGDPYQEGDVYQEGIESCDCLSNRN